MILSGEEKRKRAKEENAINLILRQKDIRALLLLLATRDHFIRSFLVDNNNIQLITVSVETSADSSLREHFPGQKPF